MVLFFAHKEDSYSSAMLTLSGRTLVGTVGILGCMDIDCMV